MTYQNNLHIRQCPILVMAVLATILSCCSTNRQKGLTGVLATADSLANSTPYSDSAVKLLEQVGDSLMRQDEATRMAYKLLCIEAYDRIWQTYEKESEIFEILEYYERKGNKSMLPVALYYAGRHSAKQHDTPAALDYFHRAHELIARDSSNFMNIKICTQMGNLYSQQMLYKMSRNLYEEALRYSLAANDTIWMLWNLRDIGGSYQMVGDLSSCDSYLHEALRLAEAKRDTMTVKAIQVCLSDNNIEMGRYDSAMVYLRPVLASPLKDDKSPIYTNASRIYYHLNQPDSALYYIGKVLEVGTIQGKTIAYRNRTRIDLMRGDVAAARSDFENYVLCIDSMNHITASEALAKAAATYDYSMKERDNMRLQEENRMKSLWVWVLTLACVALLSLLLWGYTFLKKRRAEERNRSLSLEKAFDEQAHDIDRTPLEKTQEVNNTIDNFLKKSDEMTLDIKKVQEGIALLKKDLSAILNTPEAELEAKIDLQDVIALFRTHLKKATTPSEEDWKRLEESIMVAFPTFLQIVPDDLTLNAMEEKVCWLTKLKFGSKEIGSLMDKSPQGVDSIRSRLYLKIFKKKGTSKDFNDFIKKI